MFEKEHSEVHSVSKNILISKRINISDALLYSPECGKKSYWPIEPDNGQNITEEQSLFWS